ncbi:WG repeat-containing protein [Flavobacterium psychrophilum]|uniref:WG repeat-containing protein n=1 Tax=Flavobacterium psychrophilum TaxID=96345 RepID=UPI00374E10C8
MNNGIIRVTKDNKNGVLDTLNNIVLPTKFDNISLNNNLIIAQIKGTKDLYNFQ